MLQLEITNSTLVQTQEGTQTLGELLKRPVHSCLWAILWTGGMTFHNSHKSAKSFASMQVNCTPQSNARLVDVSQSIYDAVASCGFLVTDIKSFSEALTYEVKESCLH